MNTFRPFIRWLGRLEIAASMLLLSLMILINLMEITSRTLFSYSFLWVQELTLFFAVWMIFLGASYLLKRKELIKVDFFVELFPNRIKLVIVLLTKFAVVVFLVAAFLYGWKLQIVQAQSKSNSLHLPSNLFSLPVLYASISMVLSLLNDIVETVMVLLGIQWKEQEV